MRRFAIASAFLHLIILAVTMLGIFQWNRSEVHIMQPIPVEIVDSIAETSKSPQPTNTPQPTTDKSAQAPPKQDNAAQQPVPPPAPEPEPKVESPPEPIAQPPQDKPLPKPDLTDTPAAKVEPVPATPQPKPRPPKPKVKPKPEPKPKPKPAENDFASVLKNLAKTRSNSKSEHSKDAAKTGGLGGELSPQTTASELDRVRKQIESVWRIPAGTKDIEKIQVTLKIMMNPDRTVREARIINHHLMVDMSYRIVAESALRAVNEFKYQPLELPVNKYQVWKEITITFDPKHVL
jgi:hypothetical protein